MKRLLTLGIILITTFSIGSEDGCCKHKHVGDHMYLYTGLDDTTSDYACVSECVYSKSGEPDSKYCFKDGDQKSACKDDDVKPYHQFYSGLSSLHGYLKSQLTPEQSAMVLNQPEDCSNSNCPNTEYCWHGQCVGEDETDPGNPEVYIEAIPKLRKYLSLFNHSACSEVIIECYGVCLDKIVKALAICFNDWWWDVKSCVFGPHGILKTAVDCLPCICLLIKEHWPDWYNEIWGGLDLLADFTSVGFDCFDLNKPKPTSHQCDRPCSPNSPRKCVFDFKLEVLQSDADGRRADGRLRSVLAYNGQIPGPPIVICEGDELVVNFRNDITGNMTNVDGSSNLTTLHFHGIREKHRPWSDGVPFVTQCPITPGDNFTYGFNASDMDGAPPGTYWYHSHVGAQRTNGAYGALIIKEKVQDENVIDDANNTLVLQEWYENSTNQIPQSILINGRGRIGRKKYTGGDEEISKYLSGKGASFTLVENKDFNAENFTTNYTEFHVKEDTSYRFRIIGAISQNFPLRLSIDDHTFTAIAMDSLNIEQVPDLTDLWLAAGERYDIVVKTKTAQTGEAYKIRVLGYTDQSNHAAGSLCTIAWLKYPNQSINYTYVTDHACTGFDLPSPLRTLNPVPNSYTAWENRIKYPAWNNPSNTGDIFIVDLRAIKPERTINLDHGQANLNTHYIEFVGNITFNNLRMSYPRVPFLLQDPANETDRCGSDCGGHVGHSPSTKIPYLYTNCTTKTPANCIEGKYCECQNVIKEPWAPGYWAEIVLVNNDLTAASHPIHQHGGWYWVVGEGQYNHSINSTFIKGEDKKKLLSRNFDWPPAKDTIQVPPGGYVILRTKLDNAGTWIFHCHINYHVTIGMAMVLQIGELGKPDWEGQDWCTGPLDRNVKCKTPPPSPIKGGPKKINWVFGEPNGSIERCVAPGGTVTFSGPIYHNVNKINETIFNNCEIYNSADYPGTFTFPAPKLDGSVPETYYFACGRGGPAGSPSHGYHCKNGMKAKIVVRNSCPH